MLDTIENEIQLVLLSCGVFSRILLSLLLPRCLCGGLNV
jgi:hypothetical protein